jgi:ABC-type multidrug transport system fused ATPase/permease subunit
MSCGDAPVISVAHRLSSIANFDQVAVFAGGEVLEVGNPQQLLQEDSAFKQLYYASDM